MFRLYKWHRCVCSLITQNERKHSNLYTLTKWADKCILISFRLLSELKVNIRNKKNVSHLKRALRKESSTLGYVTNFIPNSNYRRTYRHRRTHKTSFRKFAIRFIRASFLLRTISTWWVRICVTFGLVESCSRSTQCKIIICVSFLLFFSSFFV